jgi:hypothetical protein
VITAGVIPGLHVAYKPSHLKQYFKEAQALRTETTINDPKDLLPDKSLHTLPKLRAIGHHVNTRLHSTSCGLLPTSTLMRPENLTWSSCIPALKRG